jgi:hypothetical protein
VLLCTDLHGDNILAAQRAPGLVIRPGAGQDAAALVMPIEAVLCLDRPGGPDDTDI